MTGRRVQWTITVAVGFALAIATAWAHARLKSASPSQDSTVKTGLAEIRLTFNEPIEAALSVIELDDASGQVLATSKGVPICERKVCTLHVDPLKAGAYVVRYHVLSEDGHVVAASYGFKVAD